jgi:Hg(II)-responsive transcriptional regulator
MTRTTAIPQTFRIGELARRAGVRVDTVRYYEKRGLLPRPARLASGYRDFGPDSLRRLAFIRRAQRLGFSLEEIAELLRLSSDIRARCSDLRDVAAARRADIEARLRDLDRMRTALTQLMECCDADLELAQCPILECLPGGEVDAARPSCD